LGISLSGQSGLLLTACLLGFVLGAVYDIFRIARVVVRSGCLIVIVQDILFWLLCATVTFVFLLIQNNGRVRVLVIVSEGIGAALYYYTIGVFVLRKVKDSERAVKRRARSAVAAAMSPLSKIRRTVGHQIARGGRKADSLFKKESKLLKIRLQVQRKMMYNLIRPANKPDIDSKK
jgi:spore cortex biosynthesis protein YabQ